MKSKKTLYILCFLVMLMNFTNIFTQNKFYEIIHGPQPCYLLSMDKTNSGGFICGGYGNLDSYVINLDNNGNINWSNLILIQGAEYFHSVIQNFDGGFTAGGYTNSIGSGSDDFCLSRFNSDGNVIWHKTIGGTEFDFCFSMTQCNDSGFVMAGKSDSYSSTVDILIVKVNYSGSILWGKTIGLTISDVARSVIQTNDGGYAVTGNVLPGPANNYDCYFAKLDSLGNFQWNRTIGNTGSSSEDYASSVIQTMDNGFAIGGYTNSYGAGNYDFYIIKLSSSGALEWTKTIGSGAIEKGYSIIQTADSGFAIAGTTTYFGSYDACLVKTDKYGNIEWNRIITGTYNDEFHCVKSTFDDGFLAAGFSFVTGGGGGLVVKFDSAGNQCNQIVEAQMVMGIGGNIANPIPQLNSVSPVVLDQNVVAGNWGDLVIQCQTTGQNGNSQNVNNFSLSQNYPNPFNPVTQIGFKIAESGFVRLTVFDMLGKEVEILISKEMHPGTYESDWDASAYPSGVYYYRLEIGDFSETKKMVLIK